MKKTISEKRPHFAKSDLATRGKKAKSVIDINHVAKLANLELTVAEKKKFSAQLSQILEYVAKLSEVDTKKVKPLAYAAGLANVWREDTAAPSLSVEDVLKNAKRRHEDFFKVKAIFNTEP